MENIVIKRETIKRLDHLKNYIETVLNRKLFYHIIHIYFFVFYRKDKNQFSNIRISLNLM